MVDRRATYEVALGYHKKGDDARACHRDKDDRAGFIRHAEMLERDAHVLRRLATLANEGKLAFVDADTHWIWIRCEKEVGDPLVQEGLLWRDESAEHCDEIRMLEEEDAELDAS